MAKKFEIQKQGFGSVAAAYNDLLGIKSESQIVLLPLSQLDEIDDQPFPINESKVEQIADSIENVGVIEPIIVVKNGERYNILSGRHRFRACQKVGKTEIPCYVKETDDTTARYILIATNTDRNNEYSPIVYAHAYAEQLELMKKLGKKAVVNAIAEQNGINRKQIYRYLRLNYLIEELQKWVEDKVLTIEAAVELSFLSDKKQLAFFNHLNALGIADNVISRTFKVDKTKSIRQTAETISDEVFSANIDKIIFGRYGQESKTEPVEDVTELAPETEPEQEIEPDADPTEEEIEEQPEEPTSVINTPLPKKEKMGLEAPKTKPEETAETARTSPTEKAAKPDNNSFEEIVKGYMLLALQAHGIEMENISMAQLDAILDRYTKEEAAEIYRREV
ncbi:MAG: ParB N-terminal domain-containing protein [Clostridia bacterium]|nr:ParB N-terminal domain-containing protein [Clostridia bacterium]